MREEDAWHWFVGARWAETNGELSCPACSVKGKAPCQLKRELGVDYKTAFVLLHKLREAIAAQRVGLQLGGVVETDGMYLGGHARPKNRAEDRVNRRVAGNRTVRRMAIVALRERGPGARTLAVQAPKEVPLQRNDHRRAFSRSPGRQHQPGRELLQPR